MAKKASADIWMTPYWFFRSNIFKTSFSLVGQILTDCSSRALIMNTANHVDTRNTTAFIPPMILAAARCFHGMDQGIYIAIRVFWYSDSTYVTLHLVLYKSHFVYLFIYLFGYLFVSKAYSSYSSQYRKLKINMSNGYKIPQLVMYFMCL